MQRAGLEELRRRLQQCDGGEVERALSLSPKALRDRLSGRVPFDASELVVAALLARLPVRELL